MFTLLKTTMLYLVLGLLLKKVMYYTLQVIQYISCWRKSLHTLHTYSLHTCNLFLRMKTSTKRLQSDRHSDSTIEVRTGRNVGCKSDCPSVCYPLKIRTWLLCWGRHSLRLLLVLSTLASRSLPFVL